MVVDMDLDADEVLDDLSRADVTNSGIWRLMAGNPCACSHDQDHVHDASSWSCATEGNSQW